MKKIIRICLQVLIVAISTTAQAQQGDARIVIQIGHNTPEDDQGKAFAPDSKHFLTYDGGGTYVLWEMETGREVQRFRTGQIPLTSQYESQNLVAVSQPCLSGDLQFLLTDGTGSSFFLWDVNSGKILKSFGQSDDEKTCFQAYFSADDKKIIYLAGTGKGLKLCIYTIATGAKESFLFQATSRSGVTNPFYEEIKGLFLVPSYMAVSSNQKKIALGMQDGRCILFDFEEMKKLSGRREISMNDMTNVFVDTSIVKKVLFTDNDKTLLIYTRSRIAYYDAKKAKLIKNIPLPVHRSYKLNSKTGNISGGFTEVDEWKEGSSLSDNGKFLVIYEQQNMKVGGQINLFTLPDHQLISSFPAQCQNEYENQAIIGQKFCTGPILGISNDGKYCYGTSKEVLMNTDGTVAQVIRSKSIVLTKAGFKQNIKGFYVGMLYNDAFLFNGNTGKIERLRKWQDPTDTANFVWDNYRSDVYYGGESRIVVSRDQHLAITVQPLSPATGSQIVLWDWDTEKPLKKMSAEYPELYVYEISADNQYATINNDLFSIKQQKFLPNPSRSLSFSRDGKSLYQLAGERIKGYYRFSFNTYSLPACKIIKKVPLKLTKLVPTRTRYTTYLDSTDYYGADILSDGKTALSFLNHEFVYFNVLTGAELGRFAPKDSLFIHALSNDEKLMAYATADDKSIRILDLTSKTVLQTLKGHQENVHSISFSDDNQKLITASQDRTAKIWDVRSGQQLASFSAYGVNDYILQTPDGYYMAAKNGAQALHFVKDKKVYLFDQFDLQYNRPDIVLERLGMTPSATIAFYRKAYEKRLKIMGFDPANFERERSFNVPTVQIVNPGPSSKRTNSKQLACTVQASDKLYKLERLNVLVNGVQTYGSKGLSLKKLNTSKTTLPLNIALSTGKNTIQVSVLNEHGTESIAERLEIICDAPAAKPTLFLVAIGADKYKNASMNLTFASKDARDMVTTFGANPAYNKVNSYILSGNDVNKSSIVGLKKILQNSTVDDHVIVFYAGHGVFSSSLDYYLGTYDMDFSNPAHGGLLYEDLESLLDSIPARNKIMLVDACHSGEIDKESVVLVANKHSEVGEVTFRKAGDQQIEQKQLGLENSFEMMKQLFTDLRKATGATVISAAGGGQFALEGTQWKNGVFTYSLLSGLKNKKADMNNDGKILLSELLRYVQSTVSELTKGNQIPNSRAENLVNDFQIW